MAGAAGVAVRSGNRPSASPRRVIVECEAGAPRRGGNAALPAGGLFDCARGQVDLFD
jgi:hypothetical protein